MAVLDKTKARAARRRALGPVSALALSALVLSPVAATLAFASANTWYAYADGGLPAGSQAPASCPQTPDTSRQCTLGEALSAAGAGDFVDLATPGSSGAYVGNWDVATAGTSSAAPLTIEPATGVASPVLDGNSGSSSGCTTSSCQGAVLAVNQGVFLVVDDITVQNGDDTGNGPFSVGAGGAIAASGGANVSVNGLTFLANTAAISGGAIAISDGDSGALTVTASTFSGNTASGRNGGAIDNGDDVGSGALTITGSTFWGNTASGDGGAVDNADNSGTSDLSISNSTFWGNAAGGDGGAVDNADNSGTSDLSISNSTFSGNNASGGNGGAVDNADTGTGAFNMSSSTFSGNTANVDGGAVDNADNSGNGDLSISSSAFSGNTASGDGGAIDNADDGGNSDLSISNSAFSGNNASGYDGGAVDNADESGNSDLTVSSSTFSGNTARYDGGAVDNADDGGTGAFTLDSSNFSSNSAGWGGAVFTAGDSGTATTTLSGSTFSKNSASDEGGAIDNADFSGQGSLSVTDATFSDNTAALDGGAVDNGDGSGSSGSGSSGSGSSGTLTATASTFSGNVASSGGAINSGSGGGTGNVAIYDSTFAANQASLDGGALDEGDFAGAGSASVVASTFLANTLSGTAPGQGPTIYNGGPDPQSSATSTSSLAVAADIFDGACAQGGGTWSDGGYNVGSDASCFSSTPASTDDDAGGGLSSWLGPLADNEGPTETVLPLAGNPALGMIPAGTSVMLSSSVTLCPTTDQRGVPSTAGQACDAGSVQVAPPSATTTTPAPVTTATTAPTTATGPVTTTTAKGTTTATAPVTTATTAPTTATAPVTTTTAKGTTTTTAPVTTATTAPTTATAPVTTTTAKGTATTAPAAQAHQATAPSFPHADLSLPNGALVSFGTGHYVLAGGRAFLATASELAKVKKVDHAKALSAPPGTVAPTSRLPRPGTLLSTRAVDGDPTIYVAGNDGELHGFASAGQFRSDGYDPALVVSVPSLGGLQVGGTAGAEGNAVTALSTRADGAIVRSAGAFYVFGGGRAFGIGSPAKLAAVRKADKAEVLSGTVGRAETGAPVASGVLLSMPGQVYVSYAGSLYPFKAFSQLANDGYGGTAAVPVPGKGGVSTVTAYRGR